MPRMHKGTSMAKIQTRRTVSVSLATYRRLREFCEDDGRPMSQVVEVALLPVLAREPGDEERVAELAGAVEDLILGIRALLRQLQRARAGQ